MAYSRFVGTAISTFGICYNMDRLAELGVDDLKCGMTSQSEAVQAGWGFGPH